MRRTFVLLLLLSFTGAARAADAVTAGIGLPNGAIGVEWLRTFEPSRTGAAVGIGRLGLGGRVQYRFASASSLRSPYASAGVLFMPWETDQYSDAPAMVLLEGGWQAAAREGSGLYGDVGAGVGRAVGPRTRGNLFVISVRLLVGWRFGS